MLIKVTIENFKSFEEPVEFTMVSSSKIRKLPEQKIKFKSVNLLKLAAIYGANASGKSNFVDFFVFFKRVVTNQLMLDTRNLFCKNHKENENKESKFEIQFSVNNKFYAYGFSAILSKGQIISEWLYELKTNCPSCIFERNKKGNIEINLNLNKEESVKLNTYIDDFKGNNNQLFLSEMNRNKNISNNSTLFVFKEVYNLIINKLIIIRPNASITGYQLFFNKDSLEYVNNLIKTFDTGITNITIKDMSYEELKNKIPPIVLEDIEKHFNTNQMNKKYHFSMRINNSFFNITFDGNKNTKISTISLKHGNAAWPFGFEDESDGTRRLFELLDILLIKREDLVFVVDELERSLHPKLSQHFIKLFTERYRNEQAQLIFTTHESTIMDQNILRRDEIWFVERDFNNKSKIYSLDSFKERYDKALEKAYLDGRYGAIPVFSLFKFKD